MVPIQDVQIIDSVIPTLQSDYVSAQLLSSLRYWTWGLGINLVLEEGSFTTKFFVSCL